jgi:hypothetical protein
MLTGIYLGGWRSFGLSLRRTFRPHDAQQSPSTAAVHLIRPALNPASTTSSLPSFSAIRPMWAFTADVDIPKFLLIFLIDRPAPTVGGC